MATRVPDNPATLDAAWRAGVELEVQTFRQLAPNAYMSGHLGEIPPDPGDLAVFNGDSLVFDAVNVQDGVLPFSSLWQTYNEWFSAGRQPGIAMVQSSPQNQIAYGYGFNPQQTMLPSTLAFAQELVSQCALRAGAGVDEWPSSLSTLATRAAR